MRVSPLLDRRTRTRVSVAAAVAAFLVSSPTYVSLALGMLLAAIIAFAIDTALALRAKKGLQELAALQ
jgi:predicted outer membrane lipoprotein